MSFMIHLPPVGSISPTSISIVVLFPAPLGPKKPNMSLSAISKFRLSTAFFPLYAFVRFSVFIILSPSPLCLPPLLLFRYLCSTFLSAHIIGGTAYKCKVERSFQKREQANLTFTATFCFTLLVTTFSLPKSPQLQSLRELL